MPMPSISPFRFLIPIILNPFFFLGEYFQRGGESILFFFVSRPKTRKKIRYVCVCVCVCVCTYNHLTPPRRLLFYPFSSFVLFTFAPSISLSMSACSLLCSS